MNRLPPDGATRPAFGGRWHETGITCHPLSRIGTHCLFRGFDRRAVALLCARWRDGDAQRGLCDPQRAGNISRTGDGA